MADGDTRDDLSRHWWSALDKGELSFQRCDACSASVFYPRHACPVCLSEDLGWRTSTGQGTLYAFTIVHRAPTQALRAITPYPVVMVDLDEKFRLLARAVDTDGKALQVGQRMTFTVERDGEGAPVPCFRPA